MIIFITTLHQSVAYSKISFSAKHGVRYSGEVMYALSNVASVYDCVRSCRVTPGCWGVNMQWTGDVGVSDGHCELVDTTKRMGYVTNDTSSFYGK